LPDIPGLADQAPDLLGVLVCHGHPDHYGLATRREPAVPLYCGERTAAILREAAFFSPLGPDLQPAGFSEPRFRSASRHSASRRTSPITAPSTPTHCCSTPTVAGSSIRTTYAHGRKSVFDRLVADPPDDLHVTLMEGTALSRHDDGPAVTERDVRPGRPGSGPRQPKSGSGQGDLYACAD
jgi:ribonuclease J